MPHTKKHLDKMSDAFLKARKEVDDIVSEAFRDNPTVTTRQDTADESSQRRHLAAGTG